MKDSSIKSINNADLEQNKELKNFNYQYDFKNVLSIPLILDQIFKFIEKDDIKCLSLCSKKIYELYCIQTKRLIIKKSIGILNVSNIKFDKYINLIDLNLEGCHNINDYSFISNFEKLENLYLSYSNISDISFLKKNKNIKELYMKNCIKFKDFKQISNIRKIRNFKCVLYE